MIVYRDNISVNMDTIAVICVKGKSLQFQTNTGMHTPYTKFEFETIDEANAAFKSLLPCINTDEVLEV